MTLREESKAARPIGLQELTQAATNLVSYFMDGNDYHKSRAATVMWAACCAVTKAAGADLDYVLVSCQSNRVAEIIKLSEAGFEAASIDTTELGWLSCQSFGSIALLCRNRITPLDGLDHEVLERTARIYSFVKLVCA